MRLMTATVFVLKRCDWKCWDGRTGGGRTQKCSKNKHVCHSVSPKLIGNNTLMCYLSVLAPIIA